MQRDFELIRKLLVYFRDKEEPEHVRSPQVANEYTENQVQYHLRLMYQAGLHNCEYAATDTGRVICVIPFDLTWEGHEFLAKISAEGVWPKLKQFIASKGDSVAFAVVNELATKLALGRSVTVIGSPNPFEKSLRGASSSSTLPRSAALLQTTNRQARKL